MSLVAVVAFVKPLRNDLMEYTAHQTGRGCVRSDSEREALPALENTRFGPEVSLARLVARNGTSGNSDYTHQLYKILALVTPLVLLLHN